jgi:hypothetical protein
MNEPIQSWWPRSIWDWLVLQFRIALSLSILIPLIVSISQFHPAVLILFCVCFGPTIALIFVVTRGKLFWTLLLISFTAIGGLIGIVLMIGGADHMNSDQKLLVVIVLTTLFWWIGLKIKWRFEGQSRALKTGAVRQGDGAT